MRYIYRKLDNVNIDEMKTSLIYNINTINTMKCELKKLKALELKESENNVSVNNEKIFIRDDFDFQIDENEDDFLEEVNYYYERIKEFDLNKNEDLSILESELPSKINFKYQEIVLGICLLLVREINEIRDFIETEKNDISIDDLRYLKDDISDIQYKITAIKKISTRCDESDISLNKNKLNNIVFLETNSGNIYGEEDLKSINGEYYDGFTELIKSIENGTFKNVKYLASGNNKTARISEVKGFKRRVIFDRVGPNTYVIIGIFTKKSDKDKSYLEPLKNRITIYRRNRDSIVELVKDEKYLNSQKAILNGVYNYLEIYKKGGSNDEFELYSGITHGKTRQFERNNGNS